MIALLKMELGLQNGINFNTKMSSLLHGVIMEIVDENFANEMHILQIRPFQSKSL